MFRPFLKMLGQQAICGAALLTVANLVQAQALPTLPPPSDVIPAAVRTAPFGNPILQVGAQATPDGVPALPLPAPRTSRLPAISQPANTSLPVAPAAIAPAPQSDANEWKARIERLEKQNQDLLNALKDLQNRPVAAQPVAAPSAAPLSPQDVQSLVNSYLEQKAGEKKAADAKAEQSKKDIEKAKADQGYKVGTDLTMKASWQNGVMIETPNKDFYARFGFRFQWDNVWFHQDNTNRQVPPVGIGPLIDGDYMRRLRPNFSGGFWEVGEFNCEMKMELLQNGITGLDDVWVGVKDIPFIGTVRVGHFHLPHGLEADMFSSSKPSTFLEVYSGNAAFFQGERCGSGIFLTNSFCDDRMTYGAVAYRPEINDTGVDYSNGDYAGILRLTGLPIWENDGRCLLHLGGAATYRHARTNVQNGLPGVVNFNTDAELRDRVGGDNSFGNNLGAVPALNPVGPAVPGFQPSPGNRQPWVATGPIPATASTVFGGELLYINGPFSVQAEYDWAFIDNAIVGNVNRGNLGFTGGYVMVSYFLTGENRTYDKRLGRLGSEYIARANTPFWLVKDKDHGFNYGLGAWELAARFSRLDLNSGPLNPNGTHIVQGGILDQVEAGVNWHLNNNLRVQFMYIHADRYDLPVGVPGSWMNGLGIRTQFTF